MDLQARPHQPYVRRDEPRNPSGILFGVSRTAPPTSSAVPARVGIPRGRSCWLARPPVRSSCSQPACLLPGSPVASDFAWALLAGGGSATGSIFLFRGLARGRMGLVAPISAVGAAVLPVLVGAALGERPSWLIWIGMVAALPGIWLVSRDTASDRPGVGVDRPRRRGERSSTASSRAQASGSFSLHSPKSQMTPVCCRLPPTNWWARS